MDRRSFLRGLRNFAALGPLSRLAPFASGQSSNPGFRFTDVTSGAGIRFRHNSGAFGRKLLPETLGSGCAFIDYDRDGWPDILLINGMDWSETDRSSRSQRHSTMEALSQ